MRRLIFACSLLTLLAGCANHIIDPHGYDETGTAAYYGARHHGNRTASGEPFNQNALTAARIDSCLSARASKSPTSTTTGR